jgi:ribonuclease HII
MAEALEVIQPQFALVDGLPVDGLSCPSQSIVKGDSKSLSIAAASVIAKVTRDRLMSEYDTLYPCYGFADHSGYGTPAHLAALQEHGPSPIHRRSFRPVAELDQLDLL